MTPEDVGLVVGLSLWLATASLFIWASRQTRR